MVGALIESVCPEFISASLREKLRLTSRVHRGIPTAEDTENTGFPLRFSALAHCETTQAFSNKSR